MRWRAGDTPERAAGGPGLLKGSRASRRTAALAVGAAAVIGTLLGLGAHSLSGTGSSRPTAEVQGQAVWPSGFRPAPDFSLRDSAGHRFSLAAMKGTPLILTFMDSHCHQECPLEGRALAAAFRLVPRVERPTVIAVSVNPWEDTPASAGRAIRRFGLAGFDWRWLLGSKRELEGVWKKYRIQVRRRRGDVEHSDALYLIDSHGFERAGMLYPFPPSWVSADLKTLAAEAQ
jgi:cytochrome oxidase Cu insertion factor (SCO1/SenC/PrrC family)